MKKDDAHSARKRKARGFLRAADLTPEALKSVSAKRGFVEARLLTDWRAIMGEALGALCQPVKVTYASRAPGLGATLVVTAPGVRAPEVEMRRPEIIERANAFYGYRAISRLRIDQSRGMNPAPAAGFAEGQAPYHAEPPAAAPVEGVEDARLAAALGRLGANIRIKAARNSAAPHRRD